MTDKKMTDDQVFGLAAASDLLREYGYESVADVVGRISEQEITLQYNDVTRLPFAVVEFDTLVEEVKRLVDSRAVAADPLRDLLAAFRPDERDQITDYLNK